MTETNKARGLWAALLLMGIGMLLRIVFALRLGTVDGDTAVFGLMAKHILDGTEFPMYLTLAHYAGSLASYIGAVFFRFFGVSSTVYNFVGAVFSVSWVVLIYFIAREMLDRFGALCALALAVFPLYNMLLYTGLTNQYGEAVCLVLLVLFVLIKWAKTGYAENPGMVVLLGFCSGAALWITPGAVPAILTAVSAIFLNRRNRPFYKMISLFMLGFLAGYMPSIIHNLHYPNATFSRMVGKTLNIDRSVLTHSDPLGLFFGRLLWKISGIGRAFLGMPGALAGLIGVPAAAVLIISGFFVVNDHGPGKGSLRDPWWLMSKYILWIIIFHILIVQLPRPRYMAPLCSAYPLLIGYFISRIKVVSRLLAVSVISVVLVYNCYTIAYSFPAGGVNRYAALADWLASKGLRYGFSDYYSGYMTQFEAKEKVIISPTIFHPTFCDRYPEQTRQAREAKDIFYVVDDLEYPQAGVILEALCKKHGIHYQKETRNGFEIYYDFSSKILPEELPVSQLGRKG